MTNSTPASANGADRRLLLVDFDWQDADLMPELLQHPGVSVRLVAGAQHDDAGIRLAELCGLPRTVDLADLTREIFDLALVSERSPRRTQIEGLLLALGTPSVTPQAFLAGETAPVLAPSVEAPLALHAAAFESAVGGSDFDTLMEQALPDVSMDAPTEPQPVPIPARTEQVTIDLKDFPSPEDRRGLESALRAIMEATGTQRVELRVVGPDQTETVVEVGPSDALLGSLVGLAQQLRSAQVVGGLAGQQKGKAWGAWPFRTVQRHGVVAAGGIDPVDGWSTWERTIGELRSEWDRRDRERAGPAFPLLPGSRVRWIENEDFASRLELAIERNRRDGLGFTIHRLTFPGSPTVVELLCSQLPGMLRDADSLTRPSPNVALLLTAGDTGTFARLRPRLDTLWAEAWRQAGMSDSAPPVTVDQVHLSNIEDEPAFLRTARDWSEAA